MTLGGMGVMTAKRSHASLCIALCNVSTSCKTPLNHMYGPQNETKFALQWQDGVTDVCAKVHGCFVVSGAVF